MSLDIANPDVGIGIGCKVCSGEQMAKTPRVLLIMESSRLSGRAMIASIANYAGLHGPWIFITESPYYMGDNKNINVVDLVNLHKPHGIIMRDSDWCEDLNKLRIPMIVSHVVGKMPENVSTIRSNARAIGEMAASYFLGRGYGNFAYCGFSNLPWSENRGQAFQDALASAKKLGVSKLIISQTAHKAGWQAEQNEIIEWVKELPTPVAILACNDDVGRKIIDACGIAKIHVPGKVAVLGVDNDTIVCSLSYPSLSSIAMNFLKVGYKTAEVLDKLMSGRKDIAEISIEPTHIVTRQSTDITAIEDPDIAEAVAYINRNSHFPLNIKDVADVVCLSRRTLYDKFIRCFGYSVHQEIVRVRINAISEVLIETELSISAVAAKLGFDSDKHLARYFAKVTGLTPFAFRCKYKLKETQRLDVS